jgi:NADPH:quinone reductase-like Zn-dependent oxidoreductase
MVGSLGADRVMDYAQEDFTRTDRRYDLMLDVAGSRSWSACRRVLNPQATLVLVGHQGQPSDGTAGSHRQGPRGVTAGPARR